MPRDTLSTRPAPSAFICGVCRKQFPRKADCLRHMEAHDANARRYECAWPGCDHSTLQKSNLRTHYVATHLGIRAFQCTVDNCRDTFGDQSSLIRHEKRTHGYYRKNHPYKRHGRRRNVDLDESVYIRYPVPRTPAVTPAPSSSEPGATPSPRSSVSPVPSMTSGTSFRSSMEDARLGSPSDLAIVMLKSPVPQGFTCDGGPRDPFTNPLVFEEFLLRIPILENFL